MVFGNVPKTLDFPKSNISKSNNNLISTFSSSAFLVFVFVERCPGAFEGEEIRKEKFARLERKLKYD